MIVGNEAQAIHCLKTISYYRLSAYFHPFKRSDDTYEPDTYFDKVQALYVFDRKLRLLLLDAIERIEVALRAAVTYHVSMKYGSFGHCDRRAFIDGFKHDDFLDEVRLAESESHESFVQHFRSKYAGDDHLPIWMATELLSLGSVSRMFKYLTADLFKKVVRGFNVHELFLPSWIHSLSYVRNICAHHSRLWNRTLAIRPRLPDPVPWFPYRVPTNANVYCILVIAHHLLRTIAPAETWATKVVCLFDEYPGIPLGALGMPGDWRDLPPWSAVRRREGP
jgi:abortive infection bacteriophage resistance protein